MFFIVLELEKSHFQKPLDLSMLRPFSYTFCFPPEFRQTFLYPFSALLFLVYTWAICHFASVTEPILSPCTSCPFHRTGRTSAFLSLCPSWGNPFADDPLRCISSKALCLFPLLSLFPSTAGSCSLWRSGLCHHNKSTGPCLCLWLL